MVMLKFFFIFVSLALPVLSFSQNKEDDILGNWIATDHSVAVNVYKVNGQYRAKVLWFDDRLGSGRPMNLRHDTENPNPELRTRKIIGMEILEGLRYDPETHSWEHGRIYDGTTGRTWDSSAEIKEGILKVRGYWKFKWIGKSMSFRKTRETTFTKK